MKNKQSGHHNLKTAILFNSHLMQNFKRTLANKNKRQGQALPV